MTDTPDTPRTPGRLRTLVAALVTIAVAGCASTGTGTSHEEADRLARERFGAPLTATAANGNASRTAGTEQRKDALGNAVLSAEDAVRIALQQSPAFRAVLADQAAQAAAAQQMGRLPNPVFTFERLVKKHDGEVELDISRMLSISLLEFITLPRRMQIADAASETVRVQTALAVVDTATQARQAWVRAVAAEQSLRYFQQVMDAAEAGAELARRMYAAGNFSKLQRARQQAFYAEAAGQLTRAKQNAVATREALVRVLGLSAEEAQALRLPERLPDLPAAPRDDSTLARTALDQRLDIRLTRARLDQLAARHGLVRTGSVLGSVHLAGVRASETGAAPKKGFELEVEIPLFSNGSNLREQAAQELRAGQARLAQAGVEAQSALREQAAAWKSAYDYGLHYRDEIVPLKKLIADEMLLQYNGMLIGVFDLLAGTRDQIASVIAAIDAQRDFWLADAALEATLLGRPTVSMIAAPVAAGGAADAGGIEMSIPFRIWATQPVIPGPSAPGSSPGQALRYRREAGVQASLQSASTTNLGASTACRLRGSDGLGARSGRQCEGSGEQEASLRTSHPSLVIPAQAGIQVAPRLANSNPFPNGSQP